MILKYVHCRPCCAALDTFFFYLFRVYNFVTTIMYLSLLLYHVLTGIKSLSFSPDGSLLAVGSYDNSVIILNPDNCQPIAHCSHDSIVHSPPQLIVYQQQQYQYSNTTTNSSSSCRYVIRSLPVKLPTLKFLTMNITTSTSTLRSKINTNSKRNTNTDSKNSNSSGGNSIVSPSPQCIGISRILFSHDGSYFATLADNMPSTAWIWSSNNMQLVTILRHDTNNDTNNDGDADSDGGDMLKIAQMAWDPVRPRLALVCGNEYVYIWSNKGASIITIPIQVSYTHLT